jgi:hypothetical protein
VVSPRLTAERGSKVARLALVAMNADQNGDLHPRWRCSKASTTSAARCDRVRPLSASLRAPSLDNGACVSGGVFRSGDPELLTLVRITRRQRREAKLL